MLPKLARILCASAARKAVSSAAPCGLILLLWLAFTVPAAAQAPMNVRGDFNQLLNQKTGKRDIAITPLFTINSTGTNLIVGGQTNRFQTDSNNVLTIYSTNVNALYSGFAYRITYFPVPDSLYGSRPQMFTNYFPVGAETNDPVNLADASYLVGSTNSPFQTLGGVFLRKSNDMGSNLTFIGKTTLGTGTTVGYVWTATNADGSGDYQESTGAGGGISAATATNIVKAAIPTNFWSSDAGLWLSNIVANVTNQIGKATSSHIGLLDPADWTTFNNKQPLDTTLTQLSGVNTNTLARTDQVNGKISTNNGTGWNMTIKGAWHQDQNATFRGVPTGITVVNLTPDIAELEIDDNGAYADDIPFGEARFYGPLHPQWVGPLVLLDGIGGTPFYTNDLAPNTVTSPESHPVFIVNPDHSVTEFSDVDVSFNPYLWRHTTGETNIYPLDGLHIGGNAEAETNLNASELRSGTVPPARLGSGTSISTKFLRGDSTWQTIGGGGDLIAANNLSDVANTATALANLGGVPTSRTLTINGTDNQITSSAAAQDLSANRTVTLALANPLELPGSFSVGTGLGGAPFTVGDDGSGNIQLKINGQNFAVYALGSILLGAMDGNALVNLNASHVSGTFPGQYYASNAVSGGQFPIGTLATNTGTDGQVLSKTGNNRKWVNAGAGDVTQAGQNNFTGSNYFGGAVRVGTNLIADSFTALGDGVTAGSLYLPGKYRTNGWTLGPTNSSFTTNFNLVLPLAVNSGLVYWTLQADGTNIYPTFLAPGGSTTVLKGTTPPSFASISSGDLPDLSATYERHVAVLTNAVTNVVYNFTTFASASNALVMANNSTIYNAAGNCAITNVSGLAATEYRWAVLFASNSTASAVTLSITVPAARAMGPSTTNALSIPAGKVGIVSFSTLGQFQTNYMTAVQQ